MTEKCDWKGKCKNKPFIEVYPLKDGYFDRDKGWSYLCYNHAVIALLRGDKFAYYNFDNGIRYKIFEVIYNIIMHNYEIIMPDIKNFVRFK